MSLDTHNSICDNTQWGGQQTTAAKWTHEVINAAPTYFISMCVSVDQVSVVGITWHLILEQSPDEHNIHLISVHYMSAC